MNPFAPIEIVILRSINQIESCHPTNYSRRKHKRGKINPPPLRDPSADWSDGECQAEKKMRSAGEPLRRRIKKNQRERNRREDAGQRINYARGEQKSGTTEDQQNHGGQFWDEQVSRGSARVALIRRPVTEPVEKHGCGTREDHTDDHKQQNSQRWPPVCRH